MLTTRNLVAGCLPALLLACSAGGDDDTTPPPSTLHARMQDGVRLFVPAGAGSVTVTGSVDHREGQAALSVFDGELALGIGPDGELVLEDLELTLDDAHVSLLGLPLHLTGIRASLEAPASGEGCWNTPLDEVTIEGVVDVRFDWALALDSGGRLRLATQRIEDLALNVRVFLDVDRAVAAFEARKDGTFWEWADLVRLSDLTVWLMATETDYSVEP